MAKGSLFTRLPEWIREALSLQEPDLPNRFGEGERGVWPVLDVGQGGWGRGAWDQISTVAAANNTNIVDVLAADKKRGYLVFTDVSTTFIAADNIAHWFLLDSVTGLLLTLKRSAYSATGRTGHVDIAGGSQPFVVPPGYGLRVQAQAVGVGSDLIINVVAMPYHAGYKPL